MTNERTKKMCDALSRIKVGTTVSRNEKRLLMQAERLLRNKNRQLAKYKDEIEMMTQWLMLYNDFCGQMMVMGDFQTYLRMKEEVRSVCERVLEEEREQKIIPFRKKQDPAADPLVGEVFGEIEDKCYPVRKLIQEYPDLPIRYLFRQSANTDDLEDLVRQEIHASRMPDPEDPTHDCILIEIGEDYDEEET